MDDRLLGVLSQRLIQLLDIFVHQSDMRWTKVQANLPNVELEVEEILTSCVIGTFVWVHNAKIESLGNNFRDETKRTSHIREAPTSHLIERLNDHRKMIA